jgi:hypothetical protein
MTAHWQLKYRRCQGKLLVNLLSIHSPSLMEPAHLRYAHEDPFR